MRWIVDGMNVIGARPDGWWRDRPAAMRRLAKRLAQFARASGREVMVVFDGSPIPMPEEAAGAIEIVFAPGRGPNLADAEIARRVAAMADPASVLVVTSDDDLAGRVRRAGAAVVGAGRFRRRLDRPG
jgi:predicted RNA-binding protein with PIN domain